MLKKKAMAKAMKKKGKKKGKKIRPVGPVGLKKRKGASEAWEEPENGWSRKGS